MSIKISPSNNNNSIDPSLTNGTKKKLIFFLFYWQTAELKEFP
jgi:hypothetical protein